MKLRQPSRFICLLCMTAMLCPLSVQATGTTLPLDLMEHWSAPYAITLMDANLMAGYSDGRFRPEQTMTRAESLHLIHLLRLQQALPLSFVQDTPLPFSDTAEHWALADIQAFWQAGLLAESTAFFPDAPITRGEFAYYVALCYNWMYEDDVTLANIPMFWDCVDIPQRDAIHILQAKGILTGDANGGFRPHDTLRRGEAATFLQRISGLPLTERQFEPLPTYRVIDVPYISQVYPVNAPVGCEPTALLMGLQGKGYATEFGLPYFLEMMPKTQSNPAKGFVGSPYVPDPTKRTRTTIYPSKLAEYGQLYGNVIDLTGASTKQIQNELRAGNPVVAYVTLYWHPPYYRNFSIEGQMQTLLSNNHAILLCGYNAETHMYYVADPYNVNNPKEEFFYWIDGQTFDDLYNLRHHAVSVE